MTNLLKKIKYHLRKTVSVFGLDIYPIDRRNSVHSYLDYLFREKGVDCIWDVGANTGQYAMMLRNIGFRGEIVSFEPIPAAWQKLYSNSFNDGKWRVYERCALGSIPGESMFNITEDSVSSSLLRPIKIGRIKETVTVNIERLDSIIEKFAPSENSLLKLDCQGAEYDIILSAGRDIRIFSFVQMESSIYPLYEGEKCLFDLFEIMNSCGFDTSFVFPGIVDEDDKMLQVELIFKRR